MSFTLDSILSSFRFFSIIGGHPLAWALILVLESFGAIAAIARFFFFDLFLESGFLFGAAFAGFYRDLERHPSPGIRGRTIG